jgi:hypothetical protein
MSYLCDTIAFRVSDPRSGGCCFSRPRDCAIRAHTTLALAGMRDEYLGVRGVHKLGPCEQWAPTRGGWVGEAGFQPTEIKHMRTTNFLRSFMLQHKSE